jgi:ceroid-lipofuscinosis MFS transporter 7
VASLCLEDGGKGCLIRFACVYYVILKRPHLVPFSDVYNFGMPFMVSISCSVLGGVFYAIAPAFANLRVALASVAIGRILGGLGRANSALTFAYVARACEASERTSVSSLLDGLQMIGMVIAPLFSAFLSNVDFDFLGVHFNNLNSVGLLLVFIVIPQIMIHLFLPDLPKSEESNDNEEESEWLRMFRCTLKNPHIGVPFITIFVFNFNFQFIETALAPSAQDALQLVSNCDICNNVL